MEIGRLRSSKLGDGVSIIGKSFIAKGQSLAFVRQRLRARGQTMADSGRPIKQGAVFSRRDDQTARRIAPPDCAAASARRP
ncbi:hypothetical protein GCM10019071_07040 [Sphingobium fuliginis]|uniref:Uncharacterized protein n=1 Tax=Sphingobium fuliginis (strain ATCC 27551) TaxID=336203 RepID=A0ABQ1EPZ7_SPHSA|nr:hypothetical protein GCM10019071_07040 [Sphingobium fuliginis]